MKKNRVHALQGGENALDALRWRSLSAKEPLIVGLFCGKMTYEDKASYVSRHEYDRIVLHTNEFCHT